MKVKIPLAIVDDDILVVQLLSNFLQQQEHFNVSLTAYSGNSFLKQLEKAEVAPKIVLLDLRMNDGSGVHTIEALTSKYPELKIIVLSSYYKDTSTGYMLKLGVHAFLPKETDKEDFISILYEVNDKGYFFTAEQLEILRGQVSHKTPKLCVSAKEALSNRELQVLQLICQQYTARQIADKLFVTTKTVEAHKSNLFLKTGVKNTAGLIIYAVQNQLINANEMVLLD